MQCVGACVSLRRTCCALLFVQAVVAADVELMSLREDEKELLAELENPPEGQVR